MEHPNRVLFGSLACPGQFGESLRPVEAVVVVVGVVGVVAVAVAVVAIVVAAARAKSITKSRCTLRPCGLVE